MRVLDALEAILVEHDRLGSPLRRYLRPGLPEAEVRARLASLGLKPPPELVEWYGLTDGLDYAGWKADSGSAPDLALVTTVAPCTLADAVATYSLGQRLNAETGLAYWRTDEFPVLAGLKCDYSITCARRDASVWRVVVPPETGSWVTAPVAMSLEALLERMLVALRANAYVWDAELGSLEPDDDVLDSLGPHEEATPFTILQRPKRQASLKAKAVRPTHAASRPDAGSPETSPANADAVPRRTGGVGPMASISERFEALLAEHDRLGSPLRHYLRAGQTAPVVEDLFREAGFEPQREIVEWFGAHDGVETGRWSSDSNDAPRLRCCGAGELLDLRLALSVRRGLAMMAPFSPRFEWHDDWLPIMTAGTRYTVVASGEPGCAVWAVDIEAQNRAAASLRGFLDEAIEAFRRGRYRWDAGGRTLEVAGP